MATSDADTSDVVYGQPSGAAALAPKKPATATPKPTPQPAGPSPAPKPSDTDVLALGAQQAAVHEDTAKKIGSLDAERMKLTPPELAKPEKFEPKNDNPVNGWARAAIVFAALGGHGSRQALTASLNAAAAGVRGLKEGDKEEYDRQFKTWEHETENAHRLIEFQNNAYKTALGNITNREEAARIAGTEKEAAITAKVKALAIAQADPIMAKQPNLEAMAEFAQHREDDAKMLKERQMEMATIGKTGAKGLEFRAQLTALQQNPDFQKALKENPQKAQDMIADLADDIGVSDQIPGKSLFPTPPPEVVKSIGARMGSYQQEPPSKQMWNRNPEAAQMEIDAAYEANPNYKQGLWQSIEKFRNDMVNGKGGQQLQTLNTVKHHLEYAEALVKNLPDESDVTVLNKIAVGLAKQFGEPEVTSFQSAMHIVGPEIAKAVSGTAQSSAKEREAIEQSFNAAYNRATLHDVFSKNRDLIVGKAQGLRERYDALPEQVVDPYFNTPSMKYFLEGANKTDGEKPITPKSYGEARKLPVGTTIMMGGEPHKITGEGRLVQVEGAVMDSPLLAQPSPLDDADTTQSVLVKPTRALAPAAPAPEPKAAPAPVTLAPAQPSVVEKPRDYFSALQGQESGGNPFAKSKTSSAAGLYQFTDPTWRGVAARHPELGLTPDGRFDPAQEEKAIRAFTQDNAKILEQHDISVNPGNLYIMHFMGEGAGPKFLRAAQETPAAPASTLFPKEAAANPTIFFEGGDPAKPRSLSQVYALQTKKFGGATVGEAPTQVAMNDTGTMNDAGFTKKTDFSDEAPFPATKRAEEKQDFSDEAPFPTAKPGEDQDPYGLVTGPTGAAFKALDKIFKIVSDPEKAITSGAQGVYELATHPKETAKGVLAGAGQAAGGIGQTVGLLPGVPEEVGKESTEAVKRWREFGKEAPPGAEEIGYLGLSALPVSRAAELAGGAIKGSSALASAARPLAEATAGGTALGAIEPSVASTPGKQLAEKAEAAGGNVLLGGGLGLGVGGAKLVGRAPEMLRAAGGAEAEAAIEGVRKTAVEKAAEAVEAEKKRIAESDMSVGAKEAKLAKLEKVGEKRTQLAEQEAKAAEQREKEAAAHSQAQVSRREQLEQAAQEVDAAQKARPKMDSKDYGAVLQKTASDYAKAQDKILKEGAGYAKMLEEAPQGNVVKTDKLLNDVEASLAKTKDPNIKGLLEDAKKWLVTKEGELSENAISFEEAESLKKLWQTAYRKQDQAVLTNAYSDAAASRAVLNKLYGDLRDEMVDAYKPYGETLAKYAELSRGGDIVKRGGDLRNLIAEDDLSHKFKMNTGDVVGAVLKKTQGGSEGLKTLIEHNPELEDATRQYFNKEIFGPEGAAKAVTPKTIETALRQNEYALKDAGLWDEFSKLAKERAGAAKAVEEAKAGEKAATAKAKETERLNKEVLAGLGKGVKEIEKRGATTEKNLQELVIKKQQAEAAKKAYDRFQVNLEEAFPEQMAGEARTFATKLHKDERINKDEYRQIIKDINKAEVEFQKHKDAVRHRNNLVKIVAATALGSFAAREGITHLRSGGIIP